MSVLRPPWGVCEAHLGHPCKPCFIAAILLQTYGNGLLHFALMEEMSLTYTPIGHLDDHHYFSHMFATGLLQCNKVYKDGQDELHRPPVVALSAYLTNDSF